MDNIKILFVEDEPLIQSELTQFLKRYAAGGLYIADNGLEGLRLYEKYRPDIVISDIKMPQMSGIEMVKQIKKKKADQSVIFTTAHSDSKFFLEAIELQVDGYLLKPIDLRLLDRKILELSKRIELAKKYELQNIILNEIAYLQGSMLAVMDREMELLFLNDKALDFWGIKNIDEAIEANSMLACRMVKVDDCFYPSDLNSRSWIDEIIKLEPHRRTVALKQNDEKTVKTYYVDIVRSEQSGHIIISLSEITKLEEEKRLYKKRVYTDDLTQTYNRAMLNKQLDIEIDKAKGQGLNLSMIVIDIDHFKQVNDQHGHLVGDEILIGLSDLVKKHIRANDIFARWGGEEFVLLLPDTDIVGAGTLAENLRVIIESYKFAEGVMLTCSFGVASMNDKDEMSLFRKADTALYKAKLSGRNRVSIY